MANYGNYILTKEQIDSLVSKGLLFDDLAQGNITDKFNRGDADLSPDNNVKIESTLQSRNTNVRTLWAKVLIHFNNYLRGNSGEVNFDVNLGTGPSSVLSYDGRKYLDVRHLEIYERDENGVPVLRLPNAPTVRDRGEQILDAYYNNWNEARGKIADSNVRDPWGTGRQVFGQPQRRAEGFPLRPVLGSVEKVIEQTVDGNTFQNTRLYFDDISSGQIEGFIGAELLPANGTGGRFKLRAGSFTSYTDWYIYALWAKLVALHTSLYGHNIGSGYDRMPMVVNDFDAMPRPSGNPVTAARLFINIVRGIDSPEGGLWDDRLNQTNLAQEAFDAAEQEAQQQEVEEAAAAGFTVISLPRSVKGQILSDQNNAANRFFTNTFNSELIAMAPLIYNFYLTSEYFSGIDEAFQNPKDRVIDIIISTIANDNNFDSTPDLRRPTANSTISNATGQDQQAAFNSAARDFILKMLIKTPIDILKGLVELVDPHVAISKVIKTGSGFAFNQVIGALDQAIQTAELNQKIADATQDLPIPGGPIEPNLNGEDLLMLLLCIVDLSIKQGMQAAVDASDDDDDDGRPAIPENFFPRISVDGIDFTGTVSGMLMMPPSPLGLIYLLLELLKNDVTNQTENVSNANTESADAVECTPEPQNLLPEPCDDIVTIQDDIG
jgi:hypothetical protein